MHIVYRTENLINGNFYYGVHNSDKNDGYLGSGKRLRWAIEKYGKENFIRRVVRKFLTAEDAYEFEALIVDQDFVERDDCYNLMPGGKIPPVTKGESHHCYGKMVPGDRNCPKRRAKISKSQTGQGNSMYGKMNGTQRKVNTPFGEFESMSKACKNIPIAMGTLQHRLSSNNFPDWTY